MRASGYSRPFVGLSVCGDDYLVHHDGSSLLLAVIDGLGHGPESAIAATRGREALLVDPSLPLSELMNRCHAALRGTRGAAIGLARLHPDGSGQFCGIGNIEARPVLGKALSVFCLPGIVGHNLRRVREMPFAIERGEIHCLSSDGVMSRSDLASSLRGTAAGLAERIVNDWGRPHDDATAVVFSLTEGVNAI